MERFETDGVRRHFDELADVYDAGKDRQSYYYDALVRIFRGHIPPGSSVLDVGCGTGTILKRLEPSRGTGLDLSPRMVELAAKKYPGLEFRAEDIAKPSKAEPYGYVLLSDVFEHLPDVDAALEGLKSYGDAETLYISTCINPLWAPVMHLAEALRLKLPEGDHEWIPLKKLVRAIESHGYRVTSTAGRLLIPKRIPLLSDAINALAERRPWLGSLGFVLVVCFRKR